MIAARVLGLVTCASLAGCANSTRMEFVERAPLRPSLVVGSGNADSTLFASRSDARLGAVTESYRRVSEDASVFVYDRQQTINGRPNNLYWSVTRTNERLER
ncbi:MAG: hypothetical protein RLY21_2516 [Planctomycetota bacterium]|jgi:hypothetical protein